MTLQEFKDTILPSCNYHKAAKALKQNPSHFYPERRIGTWFKYGEKLERLLKVWGWEIEVKKLRK